MSDLPHKKPVKRDASREQRPIDKKDDNFLVVPMNPISGGDDIPVGIRITPKMLSVLGGGNLVVRELKIAFSWQKMPIASFTLFSGVFALINKGQNIHLSTRIKVPVEPNETVKGALGATMDVTAESGQNLKAEPVSTELSIEGNDNAAMNIGQLVLSVRPMQAGDMEVISAKAIVPRSPLKARVLREVYCAVRDLKDDQAAEVTGLFTMTIANPRLLSDEVFVTFDFVPSTPSILQMLWTYEGKNRSLTATAFLPQQTNA